MNGADSKNSIHVRVCRWTAGVAGYIWMALEKPSRSSRGAARLCKSRSDLEAAATLGRWIELKRGGEDEMASRGWIRRAQPDAHTRKPTLIVCDQFSICYTDQLLDLAIRRVLFSSPPAMLGLCNNVSYESWWLVNRPIDKRLILFH